jgi:hypothetical protein
MTETREGMEHFVRRDDKITAIADGFGTFPMATPFTAPADGWLTVDIDFGRGEALFVKWESSVELAERRDAIRAFEQARPIGERFAATLEQLPKTMRLDDSGAEVLDWTPEQYAVAFHRTVVDFYCYLDLEPIEGRMMLSQAETICHELASLKSLAMDYNVERDDAPRCDVRKGETLFSGGPDSYPIRAYKFDPPYTAPTDGVAYIRLDDERGSAIVVRFVPYADEEPPPRQRGLFRWLLRGARDAGA